MQNKPLLKVNNLRVIYDDFTLDIPKLELFNGEITGFIGKNGAGKSTTIKSIMQVIKVDSGEVEYNNCLIDKDNLDHFRLKIGYVGEHNDFYYDFKVKKIIKFLSEIYSNWDNKISDYYIHDLFKININKKIKELSEGTKLKLALSIALSHCPQMLILDEPTSGLDPIIREEILSVLKNFISSGDKSVFFSSHITQDIEKISDRVIYIVDGNILLDIAKNDISKHFTKIPIKLLSSKEIESLSPKGIIYNNNIILRTEMTIDTKKSKNKRVELEELLFYLNGGI